jgi:signal transduction histidine kinase
MEQPDSNSFHFSSKAMLPAWVVTDDDLVVRNRNNFAFQLLEAVGKSDLFFNDLLSLRLDDLPTELHESLWKCILDLNLKNLGYISEALRVMKEHIAIFETFNRMNDAQSADLLVEHLKAVSVTEEMSEAVAPYIYRPLLDTADQEFVMGVKVSPPQGLKLVRSVELENSVVEYVDIVMAYRLRSDWTFDRKIRRVNFLGAQPAIHDATSRHNLWERVQIEKQAQITQFLSHAFNTPISNIRSMVRELQNTRLASENQEVFERLEAQIDDLSNLSDLILFINTSERLPTTLCASQPTDAIIWEYVGIDEVRSEIEKTIQSIQNGRTRDPLDQKKIQFMRASGCSSIGDQRVPATLNDSELAGRILDATALGQIATFGLLLPANPLFEEKPEKAADVAKKVKTTLLNLLLAELFLNAVKYSDPATPEVKVHFGLNPARDHLEISVVNNGTSIPTGKLEEVAGKLANKPGEKRRALGLLLNLMAAEILGWKLEGQRSEPGTRLVLSIPFKD